MKFVDAMEIMKRGDKNQGYMVSFEEVKGSMLHSGYFPDKHAGEELIPTEEAAWALAIEFSKKTKGRYVNIYVVNASFSPVRGYEQRKIRNRTMPDLDDVSQSCWTDSQQDLLQSFQKCIYDLQRRVENIEKEN